MGTETWELILGAIAAAITFFLGKRHERRKNGTPSD